MGGDHSADSGVVWEHKSAAHVRWRELEVVLADFASEARLDILNPEGLLDRAPLALCLANKDRAQIFADPEDVDRSSLAELGERHLSADLPVHLT